MLGRLVVVATLLLASWSTSIVGSMAGFPIEALVQRSDVVVIATLSAVKEYSYSDFDFGEGRLNIDRVLWGKVQSGGSLALCWRNPSNRVCPRVEHKRREGRRMIWLLTVEDDGSVRANLGGAVLSLDRREEVEDALAKVPYRIEIGTIFDDDDPVIAFVTFRNATNHPLELPWMQLRDGVLEHDQKLRIHFMYSPTGSGRLPVRVRSNRVRVRKVDQVTLDPGEERSLEIDLSRIYETSRDGRLYLFAIRLDDQEPGPMEWHRFGIAR